MLGSYAKAEITREELIRQMAGGAELDELQHELRADRHGMTSSLDVLTVGRIGVDLYAEQVGVPFTEARTFAKSIGGSLTNVAVAAARLACGARCSRRSATTSSAATRGRRSSGSASTPASSACTRRCRRPS